MRIGADRIEGTSANDIQVGGSHYAAGLQHWDLVEKYGLGYIEGCATKYITRARKKNGLQDLRKAEHFVVKLIEVNAEGWRNARGHVPLNVLEEFFKANQLTQLESAAIQCLCTWSSPAHLQLALRDIRDLIAIASAEVRG